MFVVEISAIGADILRREIGTSDVRFVVDARPGRAGVGVESPFLFRRLVNARAIDIVAKRERKRRADSVDAFRNVPRLCTESRAQACDVFRG